MGWIKIAGKTLVYVGELAQSKGFEEWANSKAGSFVEKLAKEKGFELLGKTRAVKKDLMNELKEVGASPVLSSAISEEVSQYVRYPGLVAEAIEPNEYIADGHTYIVPRFVVHDLASIITRNILGDSAQIKQIKYAELRDYFFTQLVEDMEDKFNLLKPSYKKPIPQDNGWVITGQLLDFQWIEGKILGHFYLHQNRGRNVNKDEKQQYNEHIHMLQVELSRLNEDRIHEIAAGWDDAFDIGVVDGYDGKARKVISRYEIEGLSTKTIA